MLVFLTLSHNNFLHLVISLNSLCLHYTSFWWLRFLWSITVKTDWRNIVNAKTGVQCCHWLRVWFSIPGRVSLVYSGTQVARYSCTPVCRRQWSAGQTVQSDGWSVTDYRWWRPSPPPAAPSAQPQPAGQTIFGVFSGRHRIIIIIINESLLRRGW